MLIGTVAKATGASPKAIRLYETLGLLPTVRRRGSYRVYDEEDVRRIKWIKQAQALGFKLSELGSFGSFTSEPDWLRIADMVATKRKQIDVDIVRLKRRQAQLSALEHELRHCDLAVPADCN